MTDSALLKKNGEKATPAVADHSEKVPLSRIQSAASPTQAHRDLSGTKAGMPHRITKHGVEYDNLETPQVPDMTKPVVGPTRQGSPEKGVRFLNSGSHELNALIGTTTRLELRKKHVVRSAAFISNKGGVGKTHISTNMAFYLSRMGKKALLVDLDLSNSDVTNKLGYYCENTVIDLLQGKRQYNQLIYTSPHGFDIIAGESGNFKLANMNTSQKKRLIRVFKETGNDYDFVLYDLSAGIGATTLDLALAQDHQIIITTPQDIVAGYACIKAAYYRFVQLETKMADRDPSYQPRRTFRPFIVLNQVDSFDQGKELFEKIARTAKQNLTIDNSFHLNLNFLGVVTADSSNIRQAELEHFLYSSEYGVSKTGQCLGFLARNLNRYEDPNSIAFTTKLKRLVDIFMKSVGEAKFAE